jgi:tetratricopeptide (TPR) repeat protein
VDEDGLTAELRAMLEEAEGGPVAPKAAKPAKAARPAADDMSFDEPVEEAAPVRMPRGGAKKKDEPPDTHFELSSNAVDLDSILGDLDDMEPEAPAPQLPPARRRPKPKAHAEQESVEVDLSIDLDGIKPGARPVTSAPGPEPEDAPYQENDIDSVFTHMRKKASQSSTGDAAEEQMREGVELRSVGKVDSAIRAFEMASRSPRHRFQASAFLGRMYREKDQLKKAIEWFERATQAPAPSPEEGHMLLYELADALEASGEVERALATCMELQADAGDFRDVKARLSRLSKVAKG